MAIHVDDHNNVVNVLVKQELEDVVVGNEEGHHPYLRRDLGDNDRSKKAPPSTKMSRPPPVIFDTDYGSFIDDVFALGLLVNSEDLLDLRAIITTSELPE